MQPLNGLCLLNYRAAMARPCRGIIGCNKQISPVNFLQILNMSTRRSINDRRAVVGVAKIENPKPKMNDDSLWAWIPPRDKMEQFVENEGAYKLPVVEGVIPPPVEIKQYLESNGATNVIVLPLKGKCMDATTFVLASVDPIRLLRQLAMNIRKNFQARKLTVPAAKYIDGAKDEDWQSLYAGEYTIHLMHPISRKGLDLETLWSTNPQDRPRLKPFTTMQAFEKEMDQLLEKYPCSPEYMDFRETIVSKSRKHKSQDNTVKVL